MKKLYTAKNDLIFKTIMLEQPELLKKRLEKGTFQNKEIEQVSKNKSVEIAKQMLQDNLDINKISEYTKLSVEEIKMLSTH